VTLDGKDVAGKWDCSVRTPRQQEVKRREREGRGELHSMRVAVEQLAALLSLQLPSRIDSGVNVLRCKLAWT
jgi:hypothetical protein